MQRPLVGFSLRAPALPVLASLLVGSSACHRDSVTTTTTRVTLKGITLDFALPEGWKRAPDDAAGDDGALPDVVAFFLPPPTMGARPSDPSAFLEGVASSPNSLAAATSSALARDECGEKGACTVLGGEAQADGAYAVTLKTPQSIALEAWKPVAGGGALRFGGEVSALGALHAAGSPHPGTWLDDATAVEKAKESLEAIFRSVKIVAATGVMPATSSAPPGEGDASVPTTPSKDAAASPTPHRRRIAVRFLSSIDNRAHGPGHLELSAALPVLQAHTDAFLRCYEATPLKRGEPSPEGVAGVLADIDEHGAVTSSQEGASDIGRPDVIQCVVQEFRGLTFPAPQGGPLTASFRVFFGPVGG